MERSELAERIKEFYDLESLKSITNTYFQVEGTGFIKKSEFAELIAAKIDDGSIKNIFQQFGKAKQELFKDVLESEIAGVRELYRRYDIQITDSVMEEKFSFNYSKTKIYPEYAFFKYEQPGHWEKESAGIVYINGALAKVMREKIFGEEHKKRITSKEPGAKTIFAYEGNPFMFFKNIYDYYSTLSYIQKEKMLKNDLKDFKEYLEIEEFYEKRGEYPYVRSTIITSFLNTIEWNKFGKIESEEDVERFFLEIFSGKNLYKDEKYSFLNSMLKHVKGFQAVWEENENIPNAMGIIKDGVVACSGKWADIDEVVKILRQNEIAKTVISYENGSNYIYVNSKDYGRLRVVGRKLYDDSVVKAFVKNIILLMGALGFAQINYDEIEDESIYGIGEGVSCFKLSSAGEYILGIKEKGTVAVSNQPKLEIAENRRIITIVGEAPAEKMILDRCGEKIGDDTYYISFYSLTKECKKRSEVEEKLELLREKIMPFPTGIWEEFFRESYKKIIASQEEKYRVFKINEYHMAKIFAEDHELSSMVIKAEGMRVAVKEDDIPKVRNRLREKGYFWETE